MSSLEKTIRSVGMPRRLAFVAVLIAVACIDLFSANRIREPLHQLGPKIGAQVHRQKTEWLNYARLLGLPGAGSSFGRVVYPAAQDLTEWLKAKAPSDQARISETTRAGN